MRPIERRAFLLTALAAAPLASCSLRTAASPARRARAGTLTRAHEDRTGHPFHVLGGLRIDAKVLPADTDGALYFVEHTDEITGGPPLHVHHAQDEWFYVLDGAYRLDVGGARFDLGPGDSVLAPRGVPHVWSHVGEGVGRLLLAFQPAGQMEAFFGALAAMGRTPDPVAMGSLFAMHGMTLLGPPLPVA